MVNETNERHDVLVHSIEKITSCHECIYKRTSSEMRMKRNEEKKESINFKTKPLKLFPYIVPLQYEILTKRRHMVSQTNDLEMDRR